MPRTCTKCGAEGPFYESSSTTHCKECVRAASRAYRRQNPDQQRKWREANPDKRRVYTLKDYGLSLAEYRELVANQGGACAICAVVPKRDLFVDHDHGSGDVRGLLCGLCNSGLGQFADDPVRLRAAIAYLMAPPAKGHLMLRAA